MWVVEGRGRAQAGPALLWVSQITVSRLCRGSPRVPVSLQPPLPASSFMAVPQGWQSPQLPSLGAASAFNLWHPWPCNAVQQVFHGAGVEPSWQLQASRGFPAGGPGGWHRGWHGGTGGWHRGICRFLCCHADVVFQGHVARGSPRMAGLALPCFPCGKAAGPAVPARV